MHTYTVKTSTLIVASPAPMLLLMNCLVLILYFASLESKSDPPRPKVLHLHSLYTVISNQTHRLHNHLTDHPSFLTSKLASTPSLVLFSHRSSSRKASMTAPLLKPLSLTMYAFNDLASESNRLWRKIDMDSVRCVHNQPLSKRRKTHILS